MLNNFANLSSLFYLTSNCCGVVIKARRWHPIRELYLEGSYMGIRGFQAMMNALKDDPSITHFSTRRSDLVDDDYNTDEIVPASRVMYTIPWMLKKKLTLLLCLKELYTRSNGCCCLPEDALMVIFSFLRIPVYRNVLIA